MNNKEYIVTRLEIFYNVLSVCFLGSFTFRETAADRVERDIESQIDVYEAYGYEFSDKEKNTNSRRLPPCCFGRLPCSRHGMGDYRVHSRCK